MRAPPRIRWIGVIAAVLLACAGGAFFWAAAPQGAMEPDRALLASARDGDPIAQYNLATLFYQGHGVEQSYVLAFQWFAKSAEKGFAPAYYSLGNLYANGQGVARDAAAATAWYHKAANLGYADGQLAFGLRLASGDGVERQPVDAYFWLALGAAGGSKVAVAAMADLAGKLAPQQVADAQGRAANWKPRPNRLWEQYLADQRIPNTFAAPSRGQ